MFRLGVLIVDKHDGGKLHEITPPAPELFQRDAPKAPVS